MLNLRPYQRSSIDETYAYWQGGGGNGLIVLPTGAGKSLVIAKICQELLARWPALRIGIVTHVKELVGQNLQELIKVWPGAPAGIYSAGLGRRDTRAQILFMGIQSVHNKVARLGRFDLMLVDEAHLIPRSSDTMYGRFLDRCREIVPDMRLLGLTATPYRLDSGRLDRGPDAMFDGVIYEANVRDLIDDGYLSPLISKATLSEIDVSGVHVRGGEFVAGELERAAKVPTVVEAAVQELVTLGVDRRGWLAFCSGVEHALQVRDAIRLHGISCETVTGDTPAAERDSIIRRYKEKNIRCLTSVAVLTTGFNAPHVDLIAMMRPTLSTGLYVQMVGRGFRLAPGKDNCLVLDFAGNVRRHGPVDAPVPQRSGDKRGDIQIEPKVKPDSVQAKVCPGCKALLPLSALKCEDCNHEWPPPPARHEAKAEVVPILSTEKQETPWLEVTSVEASKHHKLGMPPSLKLEYTCGYSRQAEWLCFEHQGGIRERAGIIWRQLGGDLPQPETIDEALERLGELRRITAVKIRTAPGERYPRVVARATSDEPFENTGTFVNNLEDIPF